MTGQHPDELRFERQRFALTAVDGTGLFDPAAYGFGPSWLGTGCYRGYICRYAVVRRRLVLRHLQLGSENAPAPLGSVQARVDERRRWNYAGLALPVAFTGRLLIARGDLDHCPHLNMGYWPAWMFPDVRELAFRQGTLLTATDCSAALAEVRAVVFDLGIGPDAEEPAENWIGRTFSLAYEYSWPGRRERSADHWHELSAAVRNRSSAPIFGGPSGDGPPDRKS